MNLFDKEMTMIYEAPSQPNPFNYKQIKFKGINDKDLNLNEIFTDATQITYAFILFSKGKDDATVQSILQLPECMAKKQNVLMITIETCDNNVESTYRAVNKTDISAPEIINPSDLKLGLENEIVIAKAAFSISKQYLDIHVKYYDIIKSNFYKIFALIPLLNCFINTKYITVVEERTTLDKEYFTNIEKYMESHPCCAICYPHVAANTKCSISSVYQISNIFYSNYHQIESYSIESVMGSIIHPRYGTFTITKQELIHMGSSNAQISNFDQLVSQNDLVYANMELFTNGNKNTKYSYSYYNLNAIAYKEYPNTFEGFIEEQGQYYLDHTNSFLATYSKGLNLYKSNAPVGIKVYYTFYLLFGIVSRIIDIIMPSLVVVLYSILFSDFFISKKGMANGCTISTLVYLMAIAISTSQRAQKNSKWILMISLVVMGVLNSIMVGLYIKYTFVGTKKKIPISAFSLLIGSYFIISAIGFKRIKSNVVFYSIGLALHAFVFPFHHVFMNVQSYLKTLYVPYPHDKAHVEKATEIKSIVISIIIFLNVAIFCIFKPIDSGEVHKSMSILIQILSYYFVITCSIKVIFTVVFQIMYAIGMRKKPAPAKEKESKIEVGKANEKENEKKDEKQKEETKLDDPPPVIVEVKIKEEKSPAKSKSPKKQSH